MKTHPTALIHPNATLAASVTVGPYAVIGEGVSIGSGTVIGAHCMLEGATTIGENCTVFTGAVLGSQPQDLKFCGEDSQLIIGNDNLIREYVTMNPGTDGGGNVTRIGNNNLFMAYAHIAHDCQIGSGCIIANVGTLGGHVTVDDFAIIGGLTAVHQFSRIGTRAIIGGCSKVVQDIPPYTTCDGHPAKVRGLNTEGLKRAGVSDETKRLLKRAYKILFMSGKPLSQACEQARNEIDHVPEVITLLDFIAQSERGIAK